MLRQQPFRYGGAALIGLIGGALLFLLQQLVIPSEPHAQLRALFAASAGGVLVACALVVLWNRDLRRAHVRHDQRRGISITREPE